MWHLIQNPALQSFSISIFSISWYHDVKIMPVLWFDVLIDFIYVQEAFPGSWSPVFPLRIPMKSLDFKNASWVYLWDSGGFELWDPDIQLEFSMESPDSIVQICQSPRNASWLFMQGDSIPYLYSTGGCLSPWKKKRMRIKMYLKLLADHKGNLAHMLHKDPSYMFHLRTQLLYHPGVY